MFRIRYSRFGLTIIDNNGSIAIALLKALSICRLEALERRFLEVPYLRWCRLRRVAPRRFNGGGHGRSPWKRRRRMADERFVCVMIAFWPWSLWVWMAMAVVRIQMRNPGTSSRWDMGLTSASLQARVYNWGKYVFSHSNYHKSYSHYIPTRTDATLWLLNICTIAWLRKECSLTSPSRMPPGLQNANIIVIYLR